MQRKHLKAIQVAIKIRNQPKKVNPKIESYNSEIFRKMPVFSCSCGNKILIVPDVREMEKAIENHIAEHRKLSGQTMSKDILTQEILKVIIATINDT